MMHELVISALALIIASLAFIIGYNQRKKVRAKIEKIWVRFLRSDLVHTPIEDLEHDLKRFQDPFLTYGPFLSLYELTHEPGNAINRTDYEKQCESILQTIADNKQGYSFGDDGVQVARNAKKLRILEVGVGTGGLLVQLEKEIGVENLDIYAVDMKDSMIDVTKNRLRGDWEFENKKAHEFDFRRRDFDFALMFRTMPYLFLKEDNENNDNPELLLTLRNICQHLHSDGVFVFDWYSYPGLKDYIESNPEEDTETFDPDDLRVPWAEHLSNPEVTVEHSGKYELGRLSEEDLKCDYTSMYKIIPKKETNKIKSTTTIEETHTLQLLTEEKINNIFPPEFEEPITRKSNSANSDQPFIYETVAKVNKP